MRIRHSTHLRPSFQKVRAAAGQQYAIVIGLIAVVAILAIGSMGNSMGALLARTSNAMGGAVNQSGGGSSTPPAPAGPLYSFTSHSFTNCGQTGRLGPAEASCLSSYSAASWTANPAYFSVTGGIQLWTVPEDGSYQIIVRGAVGGKASSYSFNPGNGAVMTGTFSLSRGQQLKILVGQSGSAHTNIGGGGGGSFVATSSNTPLIVAGGGGGTGNQYNGSNASTTTGGTWGSYTGDRMGAPGTNGGGGGGGAAGAGGGGGGFLGDGGAGSHGAYSGTGGTGGDGTNGGNSAAGTSCPTSGGQAFVNGGLGGDVCSTVTNNAVGGFGGGGTAAQWNSVGGGGGGYSGGGGGAHVSGSFYNHGGGGGGSFNSGSSPSAAVTNSTTGSVTITKI